MTETIFMLVTIVVATVVFWGTTRNKPIPQPTVKQTVIAGVLGTCSAFVLTWLISRLVFGF
jgi:hypothetical protein